MNGGASWAARIDAADAEALSALRLVPGLEVAMLSHILWLRGAAWDESLALALRKVSGLVRFEVLPGGRLLAQGARVPEGRLPELRWQPLKDWFSVRLPTAARSAEMAARQPLKLVRSSEERPANALLADLASWAAFASTTAEIRLRPLRFAAAQDGRVWIEGAPLPAIPGERFHLRDGVAAPCGFAWSPEIETPVLQKWLGLANGDSAILLRDGTWEMLREEQFVPASRSAARMTAQSQAHE